MRQRRVKNLEQKYEEYEDILIRDPASMKGGWSQRSGGRPVYVEIGCGKGKFISELAAREPDHFFVAIEGNMSVMLRAMETVRAGGLDNVLFAPEFADDLSDWFAEEEVQGIYMNFSDPLPKNYWYRRRLTYRKRLRSYFRVLAADGVVIFKTDNTDFFEWSLQEIQAADLKVLEITRDLHAEVMAIEDPEERAAFNIETEYEAKFSGLGEKIKRVVIGRTEREDAGMMNASLAAYNGRNIPVRMPDSITAKICAEKSFASSAVKEVFGSYAPKSFIEVICTPGSTESVRMAAANYSCPSDRILVSDAHRPTYDLIAGDMGREIECFSLTGEDGAFSSADFAYRVSKLLRNQEHLLIILDAAAYEDLTPEMMAEMAAALNGTDLDKKIAFLTDITGAESLSEGSLAPIDNLRSNILPMVAGSAQKDCGNYLMCLAYSPDTAAEFVRVCAYTAAASWTLE